jgi:hypothetical protein
MAGQARFALLCRGGRSKHDGAKGRNASRPQLRAASAELRQHPNLRRRRLRHPALAVQPCPVLLSPPRVGPRTGDPPAPPCARVAGGGSHGQRSSRGLSALGACSGHEAGDSKGQQWCPADNCALALTSANAQEQQRPRGHAVYGMQGVRGSNPLSSTRHNATSTPALSAICQRFARKRGPWSLEHSLC